MDDKPSQALRAGPAQVLHVARHPGGARRRGRRRGLGRQHRRADGDVEALPAHHGAASSARRSPPSGRRCAARASCSTSAPRSGRTRAHLVDMALMGAAMARIVLRPRAPDGRAPQRRHRGDQGRRGRSRRPARLLREADLPGLDLSRLRRGRRPRQGHGRRGRDRGLHRQHRAEDRRGHGQADRRISARRHEPHLDWPSSAICSPRAPSTRCATRWTRARSMAACSSASRASSSRAMAARTRSASPRADRPRATTWRGTSSCGTIRGPAAHEHGGRRRELAATQRRAEAASRVVRGGRARRRLLPAGARRDQRASSRSAVDTSDEWIVQRTGIRERHIAAPGETTRTWAPAAAAAALADAGLEAGRHRPRHLRDLDARPHLPVHRDPDPGGARHPRRRGLRHPGGLLGLRLRARDRGQVHRDRARHKRALVIGAETFSRILDWTDRTHLRAVRRRRRRRGARGAGGDGRARRPRHARRRSCAPTGATATSSTSTAARARPAPPGILRMEGREVFRFAVGKVTDVVTRRLRGEPATAPDDLDWFVPHQANRRIIEATRREARHRAARRSSSRSTGTATPRPPRSRSRSTRRARTAASRTGDLVMLEAIGGGFTWGSALVRW